MGGFDLGSVAIDPRKVRDGVWWEVFREADATISGVVVPAPTEKGCLLIAPMGTAYQRAFEEAQRPILPLIREGRATEQELRDVLAQALAGNVLRDWRNLSIGGQDTPFSIDKAREVLACERWSTLTEFVLQAAKHRGALLAAEEEQAQGN